MADSRNRLPLAAIDSQVPPPKSAGGSGDDTKGKHRIMADLKRLEQETRCLQEELEELESVEGVSTACGQLLQSVDSPDPLLPVTTGPVNPSWERWFEGPFDSQGSGCRIL